MLIRIISQYLETNKRLVVPQLGAFIVKVPGKSVVFSEMLRADDGILRGLLCAEGMNELAAAGTIDRFVFEVRRALQSQGSYVMRGFGELRCGPNGTIAFGYDLRAAMPEPAPPVHRESESGTHLSEPKISPLSVRNPDPSIQGLRYGKVEAAAVTRRYATHKPRRGADKLLLLAVAAAVVALATIAYVYIRDTRSAEAEPEHTEQSVEDSGYPQADEQTTIPQQ